jgi:archaemetzincin
MEVIRPFYRPMGEPEPMDWLSFYPEPGQTFAEYLASNPNLPKGRRRVIYVRPLGELTAAQLRIVELTADYLERFFHLPAKVQPVLLLANVPAGSRRFNASLGTEQIKSGYLLHSVLAPLLPSDAVASIGLTASDLYPNEKMNFVFGQASLRDRVGVWSLHYLGEPDKDEREFRACLVRALKIASHETGHMFSIRHCTRYECAMNGSNSLLEVDRHPLDTCPECMAKICWATGCDPRERFERLASFFARHGMDAERWPFERAIQALGTAALRSPGGAD